MSNNPTKIIKAFIKSNNIDVLSLDVRQFKTQLLLNHDAHLLLMALVASALDLVDWDDVQKPW